MVEILAQRASEPASDLDFCELRKPGVFYKSKSSSFGIKKSQDYGELCFRGRQVFDNVNFRSNTGEIKSTPREDQEVEIIVNKPRVQVEAVITRESGNIRSIDFQRIKTAGGTRVLQKELEFDRAEAAALQSFFRRLDAIDPNAEQNNVKYLDDATRRHVTANEASLLEILQANPELTAKLMSDNAELSRLKRLYERREAVENFESLIIDDKVAEKDFQQFLEANKWLLGLAIDAHLFTSVNEEKLEQATTGYSIRGAGKRVDALLKTSGVINSIAFAEIKKPSTPLVESSSYRSEAWGPSRELGGAVVQLQQTIHKALETLAHSRLDLRDNTGALTDTLYSYAPRGYIVAGRLDEFVSEDGNVEEYRFRSFETFRRSISGITILTYDEVLDRALAAIHMDKLGKRDVE